jgi:hypothetical protein
MGGIMMTEHNVLVLVESICFQVFPADLNHQLVIYSFTFRKIDRGVIEILFQVWSPNTHHRNLLHNSFLRSIEEGMIEHLCFSLSDFFLIVAQGTPEAFAFNLTAGH